MGKMSFGKNKTASTDFKLDSTPVQRKVEIVEKIVEVPVVKEVEVIKEVPVEIKNTEIPAKYDDSKLEELRKKLESKIINLNNKVITTAAKQDNLYKKSIEKSSEALVPISKQVKMLGEGVDKNFYEINKLRMSKKVLQAKIEELKFQQMRTLKVNIILGCLVLAAITINLL